MRKGTATKAVRKGNCNIYKIIEIAFFVCNGYNVSYFLPFIDFENNIWISETDSVS